MRRTSDSSWKHWKVHASMNFGRVCPNHQLGRTDLDAEHTVRMVLSSWKTVLELAPVVLPVDQEVALQVGEVAEPFQVHPMQLHNTGHNTGELGPEDSLEDREDLVD